MRNNIANKKYNKNIKGFFKYFTIQLILFSILIFLIISVSFDLPFISKLDNFIFKLCDFIRCDFINNLMLFITILGESYTIIILLIAILLIKRKTVGYSLLFLTSLSAAINFCLKNLIQRARPIGQFVTNLIINYKFPSSYSFPSGHSQTSLVFYFMLGYLIINNYYKGKNKKLYLSFFTILPILIMISRVILGVHYFTDVLASLIIAIIIITNYIYFKNLKSIKFSYYIITI